MGLKEYEEKVYRIIEDIRSGRAGEEILKDINYKQRLYMEKVGKEAIDNYYSDYNRKMYDPTGSLYDAYEIVNNDGDVEINTDENLIPDSYDHRVSSDYIYEKMFVEGWHGGADFGDGNMFIPVSYPPRPYNGDEKPWDPPKKTKWISASQSSISPKEEIDDAVNNYYDNKLSYDVKEALDKWIGGFGL